MPITLEALLSAKTKPLRKFWNVCVGAGRANEGLRAGWLEQLKTVVDECGFQYVRFHGLFHDDMFVYRENEHGDPVYNFQYVDDLFDRLLEAGVKPFVELGFCPGDMAREKETIFWWKGHGSPPTDYSKWAGLVRRTVQNWVKRLRSAAGWADTLRLRMSNLPPKASVSIEVLDRDHGNALAAWHALGRPEPMTHEQAAHVRTTGYAIDRAIASVDADGVLVINRSIDPWSVVLLREI